MRPSRDALASLTEVLKLDHDAVWRIPDLRPAASPAAASPQTFADHIAGLCAAAPPLSVGARTARRIAERVIARESEWTRRTALDLQRLADLEDRMRLRDAESERRRCFVLGRLLSQAARNDPLWGDVLQLLIGRTPLTQTEAKALGTRSQRTGKRRA